MRLSLLFLAVVGSVIAQDTGAAAATTGKSRHLITTTALPPETLYAISYRPCTNFFYTAAAAIPTATGGGAAAITSAPADPSLSSELAMASCITAG